MRCEEEQLVLDDRATQREALGVFIELGRVEVGVGDAVVALAHQAVVAPYVVDAALELVRAALGHGIDIGAGVALLRDVVVAQVDLHRLDGVDGDRLLGRGQVVRLQAEGVVGGDAVDGDAVVAGVLAGGGNFAAFLVGLRQAWVGAGVVLQVALDGGKGGQFARADGGACAHAAAAESSGFAAAGDDHGLRLDAQLRVERCRLGQAQEHAFTLVDEAVLGDGDGVGPTGPQAARAVAAVGVGGYRTGRTRLHVHDGHAGAGQRLAIRAGHAPGDAGGGVLRQCRRGHDDGHRSGHGSARNSHPVFSEHLVSPRLIAVPL